MGICDVCDGRCLLGWGCSRGVWAIAWLVAFSLGFFLFFAGWPDAFSGCLG